MYNKVPRRLNKYSIVCMPIFGERRGIPFMSNGLMVLSYLKMSWTLFCRIMALVKMLKTRIVRTIVQIKMMKLMFMRHFWQIQGLVSQSSRQLILFQI